MTTSTSGVRSGSIRRALGASLVAVVLITASSLFGCGGKSESPAPEPAAGGAPAATPTPAPAEPAATDAGAVAGTPEERGKALYPKCVLCHKADGTGGVKLTGNPTPSWTDKARMAKITDAELHACIYDGKIPSGMVAWGKTGQLNEQQIQDLIAYIRTFSK